MELWNCIECFYISLQHYSFLVLTAIIYIFLCLNFKIDVFQTRLNCPEFVVFS